MKRFVLLCRQHFIHNTKFLLLSTVAYIGVIFLVLSFTQVGNNLRPHDLGTFQGFLIAFVVVFGVLYVGHSFPAFRSKESTITYIMVPASVLEKFIFEFLSRVGLTIMLLPILYWATYHVQGYFFTMFTDDVFEPVGLQYLVKVDVPVDLQILIYIVIAASVLLGCVLAFTGAAMFTKQPLVKSLFALAVVVMFFMGYAYIVIEQLGLGKYNPPNTMYLIPFNEAAVLRLTGIAIVISIIVMLFVAFRKLKEREV